MNEMIRPQGICCPETVTPRFAAFAEPERGVVIKVVRIRNPTAFVEVMPRCAGDRVELPRPRHIGQKLCDYETRRRLADVFSICPPAEEIGLFNLLVR